MVQKAPLPQTVDSVEWPTVALAVICYALWGVAIFAPLPLMLAVALAGVAIALHSSLCHETIHGHPFRSKALNEALVWPALALFVPYGRFRDTHLAHHCDETLTDPYDDPETNYLDPARWQRLGPLARRVREANNTLAGRIVLGPIIGQISFMSDDWRLMRGSKGPATAAKVRRAWAGHLVSACIVLALVWAATMPLWAYVFAAWTGLGLIKIRTFLEHQAEVDPYGRTVIIEDRGPLAFLFLYNNFHAVHHARPGVPWYQLPSVYEAEKDAFLRRNGGYYFRSYGDVLRRYLWRSKDPVAHPFYRR